MTSLAEFAARRRQRSEIMFRRGVYVAEHTTRPASVRIARHERAGSARSGARPVCLQSPGFAGGFQKPSGTAGGLAFYSSFPGSVFT